MFSALTNSISARQRWAESHFLRTTIIGKVFKDLRMTKKEDVSNNLRPHQILNDYADRNKVIVMIQETMNPFDVNLDPDKLYNIGTGLAAIDSTQILKIGKMNEKHLLKNAHKDSQQCEKGKKAKGKKLISLATETMKQKITTSVRNVLPDTVISQISSPTQGSLS